MSLGFFSEASSGIVRLFLPVNVLVSWLWIRLCSPQLQLSTLAKVGPSSCLNIDMTAWTSPADQGKLVFCIRQNEGTLFSSTLSIHVVCGRRREITAGTLTAPSKLSIWVFYACLSRCGMPQACLPHVHTSTSLAQRTCGARSVQAFARLTDSRTLVDTCWAELLL